MLELPPPPSPPPPQHLLPPPRRSVPGPPAAPTGHQHRPGTPAARRLDTRRGSTGRWLPAGAQANIAGLVITGGFIYVGQRLPSSAAYRGIEPALIDPSLAVDFAKPDLVGASLRYWPVYSLLSPQARAGYLIWLWNGRCDPATPIGYVFLYFYGLERRALHDANTDAEAKAEFPAIASEVDRLLGIYGQQDSFRNYAGSFRQCLEILLRVDSPGPSG